MKMKKKLAGLTAAVMAVTTLSLLGSTTALAADGAGGYTWTPTDGYQTATTTVTDANGKTTASFENATDGLSGEIAGFCAQDGAGWDWSDYTELSVTVTNNCTADLTVALALGTGAEWHWHQANAAATVGAGKSSTLTYYLTGEEWTYEETVCAVADLYQVHRINMMVMAVYGQPPVTGSVTVSDVKLGGSASAAAEPKDGFYVDGSVLRDANKNPFVMRGTNYAYVWYKQDDVGTALAEIAGYGANAVRIVIADGAQWDKVSAGEVENLISLCEKNKLVCILEPHDATGNNDANALYTAARYFAEDLAPKLKGHENTTIINIANEWMAENNDTAWQTAYINALKIIRDAGLKHCIMCDAGGYGQGASTIINGGKAVLEADPEHNCMFSIHMYGTAGGSSAVIKNTFDSMMTRQLCLCVGEFGYKHSDGDVDESFIMQYAQEKKIGWLAWSWSGNGGGVEYLDMSSANIGGRLSADWGVPVVSGEYGWRSTADLCTVYTGAAPPETTAALVETTAAPAETTAAPAETTAAPVETTAAPVETTAAPVASTTVTPEPGKADAGDVDCNGDVNVADAVLLARFCAEDKEITVTAAGKVNANVNGDNDVTSDDLTCILEFLAGIRQAL